MSALIFAQRYAFSIYSCLTSSSLLLEYALIEYIKGSIPNGNDTSVIIIDRVKATVNHIQSIADIKIETITHSPAKKSAKSHIIG